MDWWSKVGCLLEATLEVGVLQCITHDSRSIWASRRGVFGGLGIPDYKPLWCSLLLVCCCFEMRFQTQNVEATIGATGSIVAFVNVSDCIHVCKVVELSPSNAVESRDGVSRVSIPFRIAAFGMLFLTVGFILARLECNRRLEAEADAPDLPELDTETIGCIGESDDR